MRRGSRQTQRPASEPPGPTVAADDAPTSCLGDNGTASLPWALSTATCSAQVRRPASRPSFPTPSQPQRPTPRCRQICAGTTSSCSNFPGGSVHFRPFPLEKISPAPGNRIPSALGAFAGRDAAAVGAPVGCDRGDCGACTEHLDRVSVLLLQSARRLGRRPRRDDGRRVRRRRRAGSPSGGIRRRRWSAMRILHNRYVAAVLGRPLERASERAPDEHGRPESTSIRCGRAGQRRGALHRRRHERATETISAERARQRIVNSAGIAAWCKRYRRSEFTCPCALVDVGQPVVHQPPAERVRAGVGDRCKSSG